MSKKKKIFHKPEEKIPSADDILDYLNEESFPEKSSPGGGMMDEKKKKIAKSEISKEEEDVEKDLQRSMPAPSMESLSMPKSVGGKVEKNNRKKHELEKAMLSEPLISDAVEGYNLLGNKEKARHLIDEINHKISNQTQKKNDSIVIMRIAAILLVLFMISGGSFYLFNTFSSHEMADVSTDKQEPVSNANINIADSIRLTTKDSVHQLAIESEDMNPKIVKQELKELNNKPVATDGYISPEEISSGPVLMDEDINLSKHETNGSGRANKTDERVVTNLPSIVPAGRSQLQYDSVAPAPKKDQMAINYDKKVMKEDEFFDLKNTSSNSKSGEKKSKRKGNYSTPSMSQSLDDLSEVRRESSSLEEGISLYNQNKFKEAAEIFSGVLQSQPSNQEALYYSGMSDYQLKMYDKSLITLSKVGSSSRHYDEARWYRALIYIASGQKTEARKLLKELSKPGNSYSDKAIEELKKTD
jgi:hypothetical protein